MWETMKYLLTLLFLLLSSSLHAQSVSIGHAVPLWGKISHNLQFEAEYSDLSVVYIHAYKTGIDKLGDRTEEHFIGLFYQPEVDFDYLKAGPIVGIMNKPFPNTNGRQLHVGLSVSKKIRSHMSIYYKHISNGYLGDTNMGIDTIGLQVSLN